MRKLIVFFILSIGAQVSGFSQDGILDTLNQKFQAYRQKAFQEKLFVHIDQNFYLTGETLWFRIFNVDATMHKPVSVSKVAYIEILDKKHKPLVQSKVQLDENGGNGSLFIPATLASGNYTVRVYTQWMRNFSQDYYFHKSITIVNPFIVPEFEKEKIADKPSVTFFPEGGNLVAGVKAKVAFQISSSTGKSSSASGFIIKDNSDTVATVTALKFGLGNFYFTPQLNAVYKCILKDEQGNLFTYPLPKVYEEGYAMALIDSNEQVLRVRVNFRSTNQHSPTHVFLFVHARQIILKAEAKPLYPHEAIFTIDKSKLPAGITHFTIFNEALKPVSERLYFKSPSEVLKIQMQSSQASYSTRRKISLDILSSSESGAVPADLSLAVYKVDSLSAVTPDGILPYLYLTSDLRGSVESPEYYFSDDANVIAMADNLMLTHGWRRFNWDDVLNSKKTFEFIPEFRSHLVTGRVTKADGFPVSGVLTYLSSPGKLVNLYGATSNKNGEVHFEVRDFHGSRQLIFQTNTSVDSTFKLSVNNPYDESSPSFQVPPFIIEPTLQKKLNERSVSMQVQDIYYRGENEKVSIMKSDSSAFFGTPDEVYYLDDYTRFPVMEEVMREYVPGVLVRKRRSGFHFIVIDNVNRGLLKGDPLVLLDGMPVFDVDQIMAFDPLKVRKLEVVTRTFYVGPLTLPGIVSYSTYRGDLGGFNIDPRNVTMNYEGLQLQREFQTPQYENQKVRSSRLPDQRYLLHWQPELRTGADGKGAIEFYSSDVSGEFIVIVQGLAANGLAGTGVYKFSVKRSDF
jgi:hypothetical protein